jgi:dCMP deaminase
MIVGLIGIDKRFLDLVASCAGELGYEQVDLLRLAGPVPQDHVSVAESIWGDDWLIRLAETRIPPLVSAVLKGLNRTGDIIGLSQLQHRRSVPVRLILRSPSLEMREAAISTGLPLLDWTDTPRLQLGPETIKRGIRALSMGLARPDWDEYFMRIARVVASRSDCVRRQVAAILVKDRRIIATGYNGTPRGATNCSEGGCERCASDAPSGTRLDECLCLHGEENAILQAAYHGISVKDAVMYCTTSPCLLCTKKIINSGVAEVVFDSRYPLGSRSLDLLRSCGILVREYNLQRDHWSID